MKFLELNWLYPAFRSLLSSERVSDDKLLHCRTQITFQCCTDRGFRDKAERTIKALRTSVCVSFSERPSGCV